MAMSALGVGSGLDLEGLVKQLVQVERAPKAERLDEREKTADSQISALGRLKSSLTKITDTLDALKDPANMNARTATMSGQPEDNPFISVEPSSDAASGNYNIEVQSLAQGTQLRSAENTFTSSDQEVTASGGTLTFAAGEQTFDVEIEAGATLSDIAQAVNRAGENIGVNASVINTGGADPQTRLVFDSTITGADNSLTVTSSTGEMSALTNAGGMEESRAAAYAEMTVDGVSVFSNTNTFENAIEELDVTVNRVTGDNGAVGVNVGVDKEGVRTAVDDFMKAYNSTIDDIDRLTRYNEEGENGALIGDSMVRSVRGQLSSILGSPVEGSADGLNTLFQLGITQDRDGKLQFDTRNIAGGTGEQRFERAITEQFDDIVKLFSGDNGVAGRLESTLDTYTRSDGLIAGREQAFENQKSSINTDRESFERFMEQYEGNLRRRYASLDSTIASLNQSSDFLASRL